MSLLIRNNTDGVDIREKCLGMDVFRTTIPKDVQDHIRIDRGLHIQIRHNSDPQAFAQAVSVTKLICAAPKMLTFLEKLATQADAPADNELAKELFALIAETKG